MGKTVDLVTKYLPYVDEVFATESKRTLVTNNDFNWNGAKSVKVYKVTTAKMNDYNRDRENSGSRYGKVETLNATTETMTIMKDRSFTFEIDKLDTDETGEQLASASALARQIREVCIPEIDTYVYNVMCTDAGNKPEAIALTSENIYNEIIKANCVLDDNEVPETNRVMLVTPQVYLLLKQCKDIIMETNIGNDLRLKGVIGIIDGITVIKVPANRLPSDFGFMVAHPIATVSPVKLEDYKIHSSPPGISGDLVEGRLCYDAFVLDNKAKAIYYQAKTE